MDFCGFLAMGNQLKPETAAVIEQISAAGLRQCMITGDNVLTAIAVARECHEPQMWNASRPQYYVDFEGGGGGSALAGLVLHSAGGDDAAAAPAAAIPTFEEVTSTQEGQQWLNGVSLAVTGAAFSALYIDHLAAFAGGTAWPRDGLPADAAAAAPLIRVMRRANVFARAKPKEKQAIITALQGLGHVVCMVGDGANGEL
ncbi:unnamed protein product, partial [Phaeothamnion confervicola]